VSWRLDRFEAINEATFGGTDFKGGAVSIAPMQLLNSVDFSDSNASVV
jgi:hypothetical protein